MLPSACPRLLVDVSKKAVEEAVMSLSRYSVEAAQHHHEENPEGPVPALAIRSR